MRTDKFSLRCALLVAALVQAFATDARGADAASPGSAAQPSGKACPSCPDYSGWSGWLEGGLDYLSDDDYHFGRYTGLEKKGTLLDGGADLSYRSGDGTYLDGIAKDLGLASRDVVVDGGKQGKYGISLEYDQIPNFRAQDARSPFVNQGGGQLGLPAGWVPGATTSSMPNLGADLGATPLKTERDRLGVKFSLIPAKQWEITGFFREEKKDGTKDVGTTFGFGETTILPVQFDYTTDDFGLTLGYHDKRLQYSLAYTGSLFSNSQDAIIWDNPYTHLAGQNQGETAEAPDNQSHHVSAHLGYQLTDVTHIGGQLAWGRLTQNQGFLPYTINPNIVTPALPASSLNGLVDSTLASLDISSRPVPRLRLDASYTYSDRDNKTPVNTYNYVITDSALAINPNTGLPVIRQNMPYSFEQNLFRANAGYRLPNDMDLSGGFDFDQKNQTYEEVQQTRDKTVWAKLKVQLHETVEGSLKYSYSSRDASSYVPLAEQNPLLGNPVFPNSVNPLMQAFELADRIRNKVGAEIAFTPQKRVSLSLDAEYYKDNYENMVLGLTEADGVTLTPSLTYIFSEQLSASAFYTYDKLDSAQNGLEWVPLPPVGISWMESDSNLTQTLGINGNWKVIPKKLEFGADAVYSWFNGKIDYANAASLPSLDSTLASVGVHGSYKIQNNLSLRAALQYEKYNESDWAKNSSVSVLPTVLSLGTAPQDANVVLVSVTLRYDLK
ncbi:MAG: MtrB/PioB family decaheme-associated outer membrane protein [Thiobacillaceae bacterium]